MFAGACCFDRRVQSEKVGLKGNSLDEACDIGDACRGAAYTGHGLHGL